MHGLREGDEGLLGVGPLVEVHHRVLGDPPRHAGPVGHDAADAAVGEVLDVVEARDVNAAGLREPEQDLVAAAGAALGLPGADDLGDLQDGLLAVADDRAVDEVRDRLGVERGVAAREDDRVVHRAVLGLQRDAREVQGGEHVRVAQLGGEAEPEHVERADGAVAVHGELGHVVLAHQLFEVGPDAVRALREDALALVEYLVEDHDALVGEPDLVGIGVHQGPADVTAVPVLDGGVQLTADVLDGLLHMREQSFELWEDRCGRHLANLREPAGVTIQRTPLTGASDPPSVRGRPRGPRPRAVRAPSPRPRPPPGRTGAPR